MAFRVTSQNSATVLTLGVLYRSAEQVFPEVVQFGVTDYSGAGFDDMTMDGNYNPALHLAHFWDFDDAYTYTAPTQNALVASDQSFPTYTDAGTSIAAEPMHTFRSAGTYNVTVSVWGYVSGVLTEARGSLQVTVGTEAFATTRTIYVDPDGGGTAPSGATEVTTLAAAASALSGSTPQRVMLRTGVTHTITSGVTFAPSGTLHMVSDTPGTKAVIDNNLSTGSFGITLNTDPNSDMVVQDIQMDGPIDPLTGGVFDAGAVNVGGVTIIDTYETLLFDRCEFTNHDIQIWNVGGANSESIYCLNDTVLQGFWSRMTDGFNSTRIGFTGSRIWQDPDAVSDVVDNIFTGEHTRQGMTGTTAPTSYVICDKSDFFGRTKIDGGTGRIMLRWHTNGVADTRTYMVQSCFEAEGEQIACGSVTGEPLATHSHGNHIMEGCIVTTCRNGSSPIGMTHTGITVRNNIIVIPEFGSRENVDFLAFFRFGNVIGSSYQAGAELKPVKCYNNTCISYTTEASQFENTVAVVATFGSIDPSAQTEENNILYQPNLTGGSTADGPLDLTSMYSPAYKGLWTTTDGNTPSSPATGTAPLNDVCSGEPLAGAGAIGAATSGEVAAFDFFGRNRATIAASYSRSPSSGAIEPDLAA